MKSNRTLIRAGIVIVAVLLAMWFYQWVREGAARLSRDALAPYARFGRGIRVVLAEVADTAVSHAALRLTNAELAASVEDMEVRMVFLDALQQENAELRRALNLDYAPPAMVCGEVIARGGATGWWKTVRINRGTRHGVFRNCPVVTPRGLVGRVVATSSETADILLLTDVNSKLSCVIEGMGPGARGILTGSGVSGPAGVLSLLHVVEPMSLAYLEKGMTIEPGARVLTSGLGGLFPAGLPVGAVLDAQEDGTGLFQRVRVAPSVDFASLDRVFVLVGRRLPDFGEATP